MTSDNISVYLFSQGETPLRFPVNPSSLHVYGGSNILSNFIISFGETAEIAPKKLKIIRFSVHIPQLYSKLCNCSESDFVPADKWMAAFSNWLCNSSPLRFVYCSPDRELNLPVAISDYEISEQGGSPNDIFVTLTLTELAISDSGASRPSRTPQEQYTAVSNDDLFIAARISYGTDDWKSIYLANADAIKNSAFLPEGTVLYIP